MQTANNDLIEIELGEAGLNYIREYLATGREFAEELSKIAPSSGTTLAPVPFGTSKDRALQFSVGGLFAYGSWPGLLRWLSERLVKDSEDAYFVVQDMWLQPQDLRDPEDPAPIFSADAIYYMIDTKEATPERIDELRRALGSFPFLGVLVPKALLPRGATPVEISKAMTTEIPQQVRLICIGAYDEEGLVLWHRD